MRNFKKVNGGLVMERGLFGDLFDLDGDGKLDAKERAIDFMAFEEMVTEDEENDFEMEDDDL